MGIVAVGRARARRVAVVAAGALAVSLAVAVGATPARATVDAGDASCDCVEVGPYQAPAPAAEPYLSGTQQSAPSDARYEVAASGSIPGSTVTVTKTAGGPPVLSTSGDLGNWGFSPDQDRFVTWGFAASGNLAVRVYNLTSATPSAAVVDIDMPDTPYVFGFSPHGEFFSFTSVFLGSSDTVNVAIYDSRNGSSRYTGTYSYYVPGATGLDEFGQAGWGFSPDDDEFMSMHVASASSIDGFVVDLDSKVSHGLGPRVGTGFWRFSPCGEVLAFAMQPPSGTLEVSLESTSSGTVLGSDSYPVPATTPTFETTATHHVVTVDGTPHQLAPVTPPSPDVCPPTWPPDASLTATPTGPTVVSLTWTPAVDPSGVDGYRVYRGTTLLTTVSGATLTYDATGLAADTTYTFRVEAKDTLGRWSTTGPTAQATTPGSGPFWPSASLSATDVGGTRVDLAWTAAQDDVAVTGYRIYRNGTKIADRPASPRTYSDSTVAKGTAYTYQVQAIDADGHESTDGPSRSVTTTTVTQTATPTIAGRVFLDTNGNGVFDGSDQPLPLNGDNLYLQLHRVDAAGTLLDGVVGVQSGNADGTWTSADLTPGRWIVSIMTYSVFNAGRAQYRPGDYGSYDLVVGAATGWSGVEFALGPFLGSSYPMYPNGSATIGGSVFDDLDADGVRDNGEPGLAGYSPSCVRVNTAGGPDCLGVTTAADGSFTRGGLPPSTYLLLPPNVPAGWYRTTTRPKVVTLSTPGPGATAPRADWGVVQGLSTLQGTLWWDKDADGVKDVGEPPLPDGADVRVCVASPYVNDCFYPTAGSWTLPDVPPGSYDLRIETTAGEGWTATSPLPGQSVTATITTNGSTVTVPPFGVDGQVGVISGTVFSDTDADGAKDAGEPPIADVKICAYHQGFEGAWCWTTGADGRYSLVVPAGTTRVNVTRPPVDATRTTPAQLPIFFELAVGATQPLDIGYTGVVLPPPPAPGAPTGVSAVPGDRSASLAWTAPVAPPGGAVSDYVVQRSTSASGPWTTVADGVGTATSAKVTGLANGTRVYLRVAAVNVTGQGAFSAAVAVVPRTVPGAPRSLAVGKGKKRGYAKASWAVPSSTGGSAVTAYQVQYSLKASGPWKTKTVTASTRSVQLKGKAGKALYVRVRAVNAAGSGAWTRVVKGKAR